MPRVVSLLPSATEALCLVGGREMLVGRSHECDFPPGLEGVPVLTRPRIRGAAAAAIDAEVRDSLAAGQSLYELDTGLLEHLRPDVILTQDLCQVCSIDLATVRRVAEGLTPGPRIVSLNPGTVEDVLDDLLTIGGAIGLEKPATVEVVRLRERLARAQEFVNPYEQGPICAFLEWTDPLYIGGHWTVQLIERAGATHPLNPTVPQDRTGDAAGMQQGARRAGKSIRIPEEALVATRPEVLVICPCGVDLAGTRRAAAELAQKPWWNSLPAVQGRRVALVDGNQYFNRPGPRLVEAFEWMVGWVQGRSELTAALGAGWDPAG